MTAFDHGAVCHLPDGQHEIVDGVQLRPLRPDDAQEALRLLAGDDDDGGDVTGLSALLPILLTHDRPGCWVADAGTAGIVGVALSQRHDLLWTMSALQTAPGWAAALAPLLDAALGHSRGCLRGMARLGTGPEKAAAMRRAGFDLHPTMRLHGVIERASLRFVEAVRSESTASHVVVDSVDRQVRGGARGPALAGLAEATELLVCDTGSAQGYAYHRAGTPVTVAGTSREAARRTLWAVLSQRPHGHPVEIGGLSAEQDWALDVGLAAGLAVAPDGYLALRHLRAPAPFLPGPHGC